MLKKGVDPSDADSVVPLLSGITISIAFRDGEQRVILCGKDVSDEIRSPEVSMAASNVSAIPDVRAFLLSLQRNLADGNNVVMDGRDIGTVVLPNAEIKIFLTASPEERARRRYEELISKGVKAEYEEVLSDLKQRDYNDSHREVAPLVPAKNSILVDTTGNTLEQSVCQLIGVIKERLHS
jgi:cytidylate kinase